MVSFRAMASVFISTWIYAVTLNFRNSCYLHIFFFYKSFLSRRAMCCRNLRNAQDLGKFNRIFFPLSTVWMQVTLWGRIIFMSGLFIPFATMKCFVWICVKWCFNECKAHFSKITWSMAGAWLRALPVCWPFWMRAHTIRTVWPKKNNYTVRIWKQT